MTALLWPIKRSLVAYVQSMSDGRIALDDVVATTEGFYFPLRGRTHDELLFAGSVTFSGHHGMMRVLIAEPRLFRTTQGWALSITDPDVPSVVLTFGRIAAFDDRHATGITLTQDGADLFFGPYREGTALDDAILTETVRAGINPEDGDAGRR